MTIHTKLCETLSIEHPVIQGGMAWVATAELAAAVSNAGGLGIIGAGHMPADVLADEIRKAKALTRMPFGVNLMLLAPHIDELVSVVLQERVPVVTTGAGSPGGYIPEMKERGMKVLPVCASVAFAKRIARVGADAIIVEGTEAGGHIGELTTMVLVPQVVDAVDIPVVAAGGIADGRGMAAALMLGAVGVQVGTRFMCATETQIHERTKERIVRAGDRDTVVTGYSTGHPCRVIKNKLAREFEKMDAAGMAEELDKMGTGKLRSAMQEGDVEWGSVMAGQSAGMVHQIEPAAAIVEDIVSRAERVLQEVPSRSLANDVPTGSL
ncbi:MAG: enoyl-[acyl-carrier-protein] reductase FabK [Actinobacteria bacterium]|nr:MAG: enoyl-[acyl-carrier-protein] reductase FabK [Actinomycetota bacterium]